MNIIFLGGLFPDTTEKEFLENSKNYFQAAANKLQWNLIEGLEAVTGKTADIVTVPFLGDFPKNYKKCFIEGNLFYRSGKKNYSVGFCNLKIFNIISKYYKARSALMSVVCDKNKDEKTIIVIYGVFPYLMFSALWAKKYNKNIELCLIVPDLPRMMGGDENKVSIKLYNFVNDYFVNLALGKINYFVLLSKFMKDKLNIGDRPWCVVEGISNLINEDCRASNGARFVVLYSGTLARRYGIGDLLKAFVQIKGSNFELWICGSGDGVDDVIDYVKLDSRIKFYGQVSSDDVFALQKNSSLLINPRRSDGEYTKYSFPSKTIEYFSSGIATIMNRLPGIPDEYFSHCIIPVTEDVDGLRDAIVKAKNMSSDELELIGRRAREFIIKEKNSKKQCQKIINLIMRDEKNSDIEQ